MSSKRITAITDATSPHNYFPVWHRYYSRHVGAENLILVTYAGMAKDFAQYPFRQVHELPCAYNDDRRLAAINDIALELVNAQELVLRADADEFVVPDPRLYASLREYLERVDEPYVTAHGFDVIQAPHEAGLDLARPILVEQRRHAFALAALNKTCLTSVPLRWGRGFHYCSAIPKFSGLYLFHLKRGDIQLQKDWAAHMVSRIDDDAYAKKYYQESIDYVDVFHRERFELPKLGADAFYERTTFDDKFFSAVRREQNSDQFAGEFCIDEVNVEIPEAFRGTV